MNIVIVGTGYVGLVTGTCFAEIGNKVTCIDVDQKKIDNLNQGILPIYEPGLQELVLRNTKENRLLFKTDLTECLDYADIVFSAVGTPPDEDGSADLKYVLEVARTFGEKLNKYTLLVTKSTVPVGTASKVKEIILAELDKREVNIHFDVVSNPEFLKEGSAIEDFVKPGRIVVGVENQRAREIMEHLYRPFMLTSDRLFFCDIPSAEMIKYAANSMLATRISFMNDIANLCEIVGANVDQVRKGIGSDDRIGNKFLYPGCGYGGSCFPKDVQALIRTADKHGYDMKVLKAVEDVNKRQKLVPFEKLKQAFDGCLQGTTIAVWGLSFKPGTDDMREAPALSIIEELLKVGCNIRVYDPVAIPEAKRRLGNAVTYCTDMYEALIDVDALVIVTDWKQFRMPSWSVMNRTMKGHIIVDGRNLYNQTEMNKLGFIYSRIG